MTDRKRGDSKATSLIFVVSLLVAWAVAALVSVVTGIPAEDVITWIVNAASRVFGTNGGDDA